jgi:hypothetical protein
MPNKNRVELIILGVNLSDTNAISVVVGPNDQLPIKEITENTVENCRDEIFKAVAGLNPEWANPRLLDVLKTGETGMMVIYTCTIPTDIKLLNEYKFISVSDLKPSTVGEHNYTLIYKAMEKR